MRIARIVRLYEAELASRDQTIAALTDDHNQTKVVLDAAQKNAPDASDEDAMLKAEQRFAGKE